MKQFLSSLRSDYKIKKPRPGASLSLRRRLKGGIFYMKNNKNIDCNV